MRNLRQWKKCGSLLLLSAFAAVAAVAQQGGAPVVLGGTQLTRVVPPGFYFEGQSAPTQMRNAAAVRFGGKRHVIAGMVDTSGYSADIRAKYEGFLITDSPVMVGGAPLGAGAYGFGFTEDNRLNIFDVGGTQLLSVAARRDGALRRPRPLMMLKVEDGVRLYSGRNFATIIPQ